MQDVIIDPAVEPRRWASTVTLRAQTRPSGDVELVNSRGGEDTILGIIPKDKRAEIAHFLITAQ